MKLNFVENQDLLIWNLLYGSSISLKIHAIKQKLWLTYRKEYQFMKNDKEEILKDAKNFIPDDNTLYDLMSDSKTFEKIEEDAKKHRIALMKEWDQYKGKINLELQDILRISLPDSKVIVLHPAMDVCLKKEEISTIGWAKKNDLEDTLHTILEIIKEIAFTTVSYKDEQDQKIAYAVFELAILNEVYTRMKESNYKTGSKDLVKLKKEIYPYFLMYLGYDLEETPVCMMRDSMPFEVEKYTNEVQFRNLNILEFIDFLVRNKRYMIREKKEVIEVL